MAKTATRWPAPDGASVDSKRWLPGKGSNLDQGIQSPLCYRYTTRQGTSILDSDHLSGRAFPPAGGWLMEPSMEPLR